MISEAILNFVDLAGSEKVSNHLNSMDYSTNKASFTKDGSHTSMKERVKEG
jgi:hypothetical protein